MSSTKKPTTQKPKSTPKQEDKGAPKSAPKAEQKKAGLPSPDVQQNVQQTPAIRAQIDNLVDVEGSKVKAYASATIGGAFAVHGIRVIDSENGLFVAMPSRAVQKEGSTEYKDIFHPITADGRNVLSDVVLSAYEQKIVEVQTQDLGDDQVPFQESM